MSKWLSGSWRIAPEFAAWRSGVGGVRVDRAQLVDGRRGQREVVLQEARNLRANDAAQHQHRQPYAMLAEPDTFLEVRDADVRRAAGFEGPRDLDEPMAVRVGLEDRHDARRRHVRRDRAIIRRKNAEIDLEGRRPELVRRDRRLVHSAYDTGRVCKRPQVFCAECPELKK